EDEVVARHSASNPPLVPARPRNGRRQGGRPRPRAAARARAGQAAGRPDRGHLPEHTVYVHMNTWPDRYAPCTSPRISRARPARRLARAIRRAYGEPDPCERRAIACFGRVSVKSVVGTLAACPGGRG